MANNVNIQGIVRDLNTAWQAHSAEKRQEYNQKITRLNKHLLGSIAVAVAGIASAVFLGSFFMAAILIGAGCLFGRSVWNERKEYVQKNGAQNNCGNFIEALYKATHPQAAV